MTGIAIGAAALAGASFGWWAVVAAGAAAGVVLAFAHRRHTVGASITVLVVVALAAMRAGMAEHPGVPEVGSLHARRGEVVSGPIPNGRFQYFVADVDGADGTDAVRVCLAAPALPRLEIGDSIVLDAEVEARADASPGRRAMLALRDCDGSAFAPWVSVSSSTSSLARTLASMRTRLGESLRRAAPGDEGVLLSGLVTGDDSGFTPERDEALLATSTTHLTAVSGSNLALVAGMFLTAGTVAIGRHRRWWQLLAIAGVWSYAAISGAGPPSVRAAIVASLAVAAFWFGRRPDFPTLILLAAGTMAVLDPKQIDALGFRLSVAASLALAWLVPPMLEQRSGWLGIDLLIATCVAQLATLPVLLPVFGMLSVTSLPANLIAAPISAAITPLAAIAAVAGVVYQPLGDALAAPAALMAHLLLGVLDLFAQWGGALSVGKPPAISAAVLGMTAAAALFLVVTTPRRRLGHDLAASARLLVRREDPHQTLGTDANDAEHEPAGEEHAHQLPHIRKRAEPVLGNIAGHGHMLLLREEIGDATYEEQGEHEDLPPLTYEGNVLTTEKVVPSEP